MFCHKCGSKMAEGANSCQSCSTQLATASANISLAAAADKNTGSTEITDSVVRCGNCSYEGPGGAGRTLAGEIFACLGILLSPLITIIYFAVTCKYICPKCKSKFIGVKNTRGVFVDQRGSKTILVVVACIFGVITLIGLFSTLALVALSSARVKGRDALRVSNLKQMQIVLERYKTDQHLYPTGTEEVLGDVMSSCLNAQGWQPKGCVDPYMDVVPADPSTRGDYLYSANYDSYVISAILEGEISGMKGQIELTPNGIKQQ